MLLLYSRYSTKLDALVSVHECKYMFYMSKSLVYSIFSVIVFVMRTHAIKDLWCTRYSPHEQTHRKHMFYYQMCLTREMCMCHTNKLVTNTCFVITAGTHEYTYPLCMYTYSNDFVHLLCIKAFENLFTNTTIMDEEYIQIKHG